jgi:mannose-1-phosphate guanylyltransferase/mannose-6-phosphate isomerase
MIEKTLERFDGVVPPERRLIVTHRDQIAATKDIVGSACKNFVSEPEAKNTANALCLAALEVEKLSKSEQPIMVSVHADHLIQDVDDFLEDIRKACEVASKDYLTLIGINPEYPETGYGYIEAGARMSDSPEDSYLVANFKEKPQLETAKEYVASGKYFWNSGIFVWKTAKLLSELDRFLPMPVQKLSQILGGHDSFNQVDEQALAEVYGSLPKIAIDNAVLELSESVAVIKSDFGWKDVGSWDALTKSFSVDDKGNYVSGDAVIIDCKNATFESEGPMIAAIGVEDLVVVAMNDAVLVCPPDRAQEVKKIVEHLQSENRSELL